MVKTVIFDLDGLLVNSELMTYEFYKKTVAEQGADFTLKEYTDVYCVSPVAASSPRTNSRNS